MTELERSSVGLRSLLSMHVFAVCVLTLLLLLLGSGSVRSELCDRGTGECKELTASECPVIFYNQHLIGNAIKFCNEFEDIVCCPLPLNSQNQAPVEELRPFEQQCKHYNAIRKSCHTDPFIVGGTEAVAREFPFMALIGLAQQNKISWDCGGTLIHPRYVVTAAHCLETTETKEQRLDPNFKSPKFVVRLGELDYNSTTDDAQTQDFKVVNYVVHPAYDDDDDVESRVKNDIAIIELDRNATLNEFVAPACLPPSTGNDQQQLTAAGWGLTSDAGSKSSHLLKVSLERFGDDLCEERLEVDIDRRTQFCAGSIDGTGDTCNGDSGGPIFAQHPRFNCLKLLIGITSYGSICGSKGRPSVYTKVYLFTDWIESIVWGE